jgi:hypothetical protein|tara:strand:+ start:1435 stop:1620 length:186 start_codon:yes stop_codon:yes gene_type:complete
MKNPPNFFELKSVLFRLKKPKFYKLMTREDRKFVKKMDIIRSFTRNQKERIVRIADGIPAP